MALRSNAPGDRRALDRVRRSTARVRRATIDQDRAWRAALERGYTRYDIAEVAGVRIEKVVERLALYPYPDPSEVLR